MSKLTLYHRCGQMKCGQSWTARNVQFGAKKYHQHFQLGEASHGFLGGQMHQVVAIHNIQLLNRGKITQPLWQSFNTIKTFYPENFKGNEVLNLV